MGHWQDVVAGLAIAFVGAVGDYLCRLGLVYFALRLKSTNCAYSK